MQFRKALPLVLGSMLLSAPFAHADFASMVDQNFSEIPQGDLSTVQKSQYLPLGIDAALGLLALRLARVPSPQDGGRQTKDGQLRDRLSDLDNSINSGRRLNVRSEEDLRVRLQEMMAASQLPAQVQTSRGLSEQVAQLESNPAADPSVLAQAKADLEMARQVVAAEVAKMPDASGGSLRVTPETLEQLGYFKNGDSLRAEYDSLLGRYTAAQSSDKMPKLIDQLQDEAASAQSKGASKFEKFQGKYNANLEEAGLFRKVVIGDFVGRGGLAIVAYDIAGRFYLLYWANRDPGVSPALTSFKALKDMALPEKN